MSLLVSSDGERDCPPRRPGEQASVLDRIARAPAPGKELERIAPRSGPEALRVRAARSAAGPRRGGRAAHGRRSPAAAGQRRAGGRRSRGLLGVAKARVPALPAPSL